MEKLLRDKMFQGLNFFIGTWEIEVNHPHFQTGSIDGQSTFDWMEREKFIVQKTIINQKEFPSFTSIFDYDADLGTFIQHYFDSRGVTRLYHMSIEKNIWKLWRDSPDFSQLDFHQRFIGEINESKDIIKSSWQKSDDGSNWNHDFNLIYRKIT